jgi:hypothetical protein
MVATYSLMGFMFPAIAFQSLYLNEYGDSHMRNIGTNIMVYGWVAGEFIFVAIGYLVQNWKHLIAV